MNSVEKIIVKFPSWILACWAPCDGKHSWASPARTPSVLETYYRIVAKPKGSMTGNSWKPQISCLKLYGKESSFLMTVPCIPAPVQMQCQHISLSNYWIHHFHISCITEFIILQQYGKCCSALQGKLYSQTSIFQSIIQLIESIDQSMESIEKSFTSQSKQQSKSRLESCYNLIICIDLCK